MKNINRKLRIIVGIFFLFICCVLTIYFFRKPLISKILPDVEQVGSIHIEIRNDTCYLSSKLSIRNKTFLRIGIDSIKYKISLLDSIYINSERSIGIVLSGYENEIIDFSLKIPYKRIIKELNRQRKMGDSTSYSIDLSLQYATVFGKHELPVTKSARIKIPQPPEIEVVEIKYNNIRRKKILANALIKIINYTPVTLSITELNYDMQILNQGYVKGKYCIPVNIKPNQTTYINLPVEINVNRIGKTIFQIVTNKDTYDYTLKMNAVLSSSDPFKKSFLIDIAKTGKMELRQ